MSRGGCDVPVVLAAPLAFAVLSRLLRCEIKSGDARPQSLRLPGEPLKEDYTDGREAYKKC